MMKVELQYEVTARVQVHIKDLLFLQRLACLHYDGLCKSYGNNTGLLSRWIGIRRNFPDYSYPLNSRDIDTICKILEQAQYAATSKPAIARAARLTMEFHNLLRSVHLERDAVYTLSDNGEGSISKDLLIEVEGHV